LVRIAYGISGEGRGHTSRALAIAEALEAQGHEVLYVAGGTAYEILTQLRKPVLRVPALEHVLCDNRILLWRTARHNLPHLLRARRWIEAVARALEEFGAEWLINDFEYYSARAARLTGVPVVNLNHQQILTETRYPIPWRYLSDAWLVRLIVRWITAPPSRLTIIPSFLSLPLRRPDRVRLVPPVLRSAVLEQEPGEGEHVLVYLNRSHGAEGLLGMLSRFAPVPFRVYGFPTLIPVGRNIVLRPLGLGHFLRDLASARAVIATAGFTLISEALYLGKPLLVLPNRGIFEQTFNAWCLQKSGQGMAVIGRAPRMEDIASFLECLPLYRRAIGSGFEPGNGTVLQLLEALWRQGRGTTRGRVLFAESGSVYS
jgi:uncharacterized protein (TIGR00661 family)